MLGDFLPFGEPTDPRSDHSVTVPKQAHCGHCEIVETVQTSDEANHKEKTNWEAFGTLVPIPDKPVLRQPAEVGCPDQQECNRVLAD